MAKNRKLILALVALLAVAALMVGVFLATRPTATEGMKTFTVEVTHKDGSAKTFTYTTAEEYVGPVLVGAGLIAGADSKYGLMIETVDGERAVWAEDGAYWAVFVNGEYGSVGIDQTPVTEGDVIGLVYTVG